MSDKEVPAKKNNKKKERGSRQEKKGRRGAEERRGPRQGPGEPRVGWLVRGVWNDPLSLQRRSEREKKDRLLARKPEQKTGRGRKTQLPRSLLRAVKSRQELFY